MARITFGMQLIPIVPPAALVRIISKLEAMGFDQISIPDHMLFPDGGPAHDPWMLLAAASARTSRVTLGTNVSDPHRVHPAVLAHSLVTLDNLSHGRVLLGLGAGEVMNLDPFGIPWNKPVTRLKEAFHIIRHLWDSREPLDFKGEFYQLRRARLDVRPYRERRMPIYLASFGPVMQKFTGQYADGWLPVACPPQHYNDLFAPVAAAAQAAGRSVVRTATVPLAVSTDAARMMRAARRYCMEIVWPGMLPRLGFPNLPDDVGGVHYQNVNPCDPESMRLYETHRLAIPDEVLRQYMVCGTIETIRRRLGEYIDAGVTHFNFINASPDPTGSTLALATQVLPYFTRRRAPLWAQIGHALSPILPRSTEERLAIRKVLGN